MKEGLKVAGIAVLLGAGGNAVFAQDTDPVANLRAEIALLRADYETRISGLEQRLADLEAAEEPAPPADEIADLRAAARQAAVEITEPAVPQAPAVGWERNLNRLNPEISMTGIVVGRSTDPGRDEFEAQEFEIDVQSALDPFSRTRLTLALRGEEVEVEEGWVSYNGLPAGLELTLGKFRQRFGPLNRQHLHALPQSSYPLVYETYFGDEGLAQTGISLNWLVPRPWANANELALEITNGENEEAFAGEFFDDFSALARLKNYWDVSESTYFEWGLSGITGRTAAGGDSRVWGTDFTLAWQPPQRAKYRQITWRMELLMSERDDPLRVRQEALGGYTYLEGLLARNLYAGVRFDRVEEALSPTNFRTGIVPYVTWWQSEYVRLRGELGFFEDDATGKTEDRFTMQLTWAAGPHKHESY